MGRKRDPLLRVCRYCTRFFDRRVLDDGTLERLDMYRKRDHCSEECRVMLSLGYRPKGLLLTPSEMEHSVNALFTTAADAVDALLIEAEKIRDERPKDCDRLRAIAARLQEARIKVLTRQAPLVALQRRSPIASSA